MNTEQVSSTRVATSELRSSPARAPVCMSPVELVAMAESSMSSFDAEVSRKTAAQRKDTNALKVLGELKAKMAKFQKGLDNSDDGDEKRAGKRGEDFGRRMRGAEFMDLQAAYTKALETLPPEYRSAAKVGLKTMGEKGRKEFDENQANKMMEAITAVTDDIDTRSQVAMAEINNLMSQRSNMIEMTKNIATALNGQQEFISRNAPR